MPLASYIFVGIIPVIEQSRQDSSPYTTSYLDIGAKTVWNSPIKNSIGVLPK